MFPEVENKSIPKGINVWNCPRKIGQGFHSSSGKFQRNFTNKKLMKRDETT
jgi:hypothetical protein